MTTETPTQLCTECQAGPFFRVEARLRPDLCTDCAEGNWTNRRPLPDGSWCVLEHTAPRTTLVSREVEGQLVWGQAFSRGEDHHGQVLEVIASMVDDPGAFTRAGLWNPQTGEAVPA